MSQIHKELEKLESELQVNPIEGVVLLRRLAINSDQTGKITLTYVLTYKGEKRRLDIIAYDEDMPTAHIHLFNDILGAKEYCDEEVRTREPNDFAYKIRSKISDIFKSISKIKQYGT